MILTCNENPLAPTSLEQVHHGRWELYPDGSTTLTRIRHFYPAQGMFSLCGRRRRPAAPVVVHPRTGLAVTYDDQGQQMSVASLDPDCYECQDCARMRDNVHNNIGFANTDKALMQNLYDNLQDRIACQPNEDVSIHKFIEDTGVLNPNYDNEISNGRPVLYFPGMLTRRKVVGDTLYFFTDLPKYLTRAGSIAARSRNIIRYCLDNGVTKVRFVPYE